MDKIIILISGLVGAGFSLLYTRLKLTKRPRLRITQPRLGILDLSNGEYSSHIAADKTAISGLFHSSSISTDVPPACDVLMVYGHVESGGNIRNSRLGLREIVRDSTASIVVFATNNPGDNYIQATKQKSNIRANLVMTLDRRGDEFAQFFQKLFTAMKQGESLLEVWVKLAPQNPGMDHKDGPEAICASLGGGHISFA